MCYLDTLSAEDIVSLHDSAVVAGVGRELLVEPVHVLSCLLET